MACKQQGRAARRSVDLRADARSKGNVRRQVPTSGDRVLSRRLLDSVVCIATIPQREAALREVVDSLATQCGQIRVYLNGHEHVPKFLSGSRFMVARSQDFGDRGDAGKFFWNDLNGFVFTCDDDIRYPSDYVASMTDAVERYRRSSIMGVHAATFVNPISSYYRCRKVLHFQSLLDKDTRVHVVGTGTACFHSSCIQVRHSDFKAKNMADVWLAILAKQQGVPMFAVARPEKWLTEIPLQGESIYMDRAKYDAVATAAINAAGPWT
jgi:hypothetical protein